MGNSPSIEITYAICLHMERMGKGHNRKIRKIMSNICNTCFTDYLVQCSEVINVFAKLTPNTVYQWVIEDKFNRQYAGTFETDADGFWQIAVDDLPEGMLNEYAGTFQLRVYEDTYGINCDEPVTFTIAQTFECITFTVRAGNREKNNLGCEF